MITEKEYNKRRQELGKKLLNNSITILFSATSKIRSNDTEFPFRQNSNFYYLTGFKEENSSLVIIKKKNKIKTVLFLQKKDKQIELWNGERLGIDEAKKRFKVDKIFTIDKFDKKLSIYIENKKTIYYDFTRTDTTLPKSIQNIDKHKNIAYYIGLMRLIKSEAEIDLIQKAIDITALAHHKVMKLDKRGKNEYELQAELEYIFKKNGAYNDAYTSIVASGNSANTLHYIKNNKSLRDNNLILIDAGCEYQYYASDITRTIPVNTTYTSVQKELYDMVLSVQLQIIAMIKPKVKRSSLQKKTIQLLTEGMIKLNILKGEKETLIKQESYKKYYPHGIGHWMGLDVHDESPYKYKNGKEIALQKGMVLTIEPAIYINSDDKDVPKKYRGIGIRIEDDILVTGDSYKNLSVKIKK